MADAPIKVGGRAAWRGPSLDWRREGMHVLTRDEVAEIDAALAHLRAAGGEPDFPEITPARFPLPALGTLLRARRREIEEGCGFLLLRGLPRERYSADEMALIYFGLGSYLGEPIPQSWQGELLGHVIDIADIQEAVRGYNAGGGQRMHTDSCDIVALMCLRSARSGGASRIASAMAVHDHMAEHHPELLHALYDGFVFRRMERDASYGTGIAVRTIGVFERADESVTCYISGSYPVMAVKAGDATMTPLQQAALDKFYELSSAPAFTLDMSIDEGDIQFLNNRLLVHGRTDYRDHDDVARRRHMMRLWLRVPEWRSMSERQAMHTREDHRLWLRQRTPRMELPSGFLARMAQQQRERVAATA
ncbi:MAG: TauD/TfdA family dioxygenase, partial [Acidisphaera sp.]|nr:TauD/TfdA family dioxygenase [Acidisphaera sp.]